MRAEERRQRAMLMIVEPGDRPRRSWTWLLAKRRELFQWRTTRLKWPPVASIITKSAGARDITFVAE